MPLIRNRTKLLLLLLIFCSFLSRSVSAAETLETILGSDPSLSSFSGSSASNRSELSYRGFTSATNAINIGSPVSVLVDGTPRLHRGLARTRWLDLENVAVSGESTFLKPHQYSLGVIDLRTHQANFGQRSVEINTGVENNNFRSIDAVANYAFDDNISAYRIAASYFESGGSVNTGADTGLDYTPLNETRSNGGRGLTVRGQYRLAPTENIELTVSADYDKADVNCCSSAALKRDLSLSSFFDDLGLGSDGGLAATGTEALEERIANSNDNFQLSEVANYAGQARFNIANTQLKLATVYSEYDSKQRYSVDGGTLDIFAVRENQQNGKTDWGQLDNIRSVSHQLSWNNHESNESILWEVGARYSLSKYERQVNTRLGNDYQPFFSAQINQQLGGTTFPGINPALNPNVLGGLAGISADGNFANNLYKSRKEETLLFWQNRWVANDRFSLQAGFNALVVKEDGRFMQIDANSSACLNTINNPALAALDPQSELYRLIVEGACPAAATAANTTPPASQSIAETFTASHKTASWGAHLNAQLKIEDASLLALTIASSTLPGGINLNPLAASESATTFNEQQQNSFQLSFSSTSPNQRVGINIALFHYDIRNLQATLPFDGSQDRARHSLIFNIDAAQLSGFETELSFAWNQSLTSALSASYIDQRTGRQCSAGRNFSRDQICDKRFSETPETRIILDTGYNGPVIAHRQISANAVLRYESGRELGDYLTVPDNSSIDSSIQLDLELELRPLSEDELQWELAFYARNLGDQPARGFYALPGQADSLAASFSQPERYGMRFSLKL